MGKMSPTDDHILGTPSGRQLARTVDTKARTQRMVQGFVCAGGLYAVRAEARLATCSASPAAGVLDTRELWKGLDWTHGLLRSMREKKRLTHSRFQN